MKRQAESKAIWAIFVLLFSGFSICGFYDVLLKGRISRALELLSSSSDEVVRPARLYAVLSGEQVKPFQAKELSSEDVKKDTAALQLPNGGVPQR